MVKRIDPTLEIPGLKNALVKMMCDYNLQVSVQEGCKKILSSDYFNLHERLVKCHQKGIFIDGWYEKLINAEIIMMIFVLIIIILFFIR